MSKLSDHELTRAIAEYLELPIIIDWLDGVFIRNDDGSHYEFDPCNNWSDLMPLVVEYKISLDWDSFNWDAYKNQFHNDGEYLCAKYPITLINPQRAAAECLLKVLQGEQDNELLQTNK